MTRRRRVGNSPRCACRASNITLCCFLFRNKGHRERQGASVWKENRSEPEHGWNKVNKVVWSGAGSGSRRGRRGGRWLAAEDFIRPCTAPQSDDEITTRKGTEARGLHSGRVQFNRRLLVVIDVHDKLRPYGDIFRRTYSSQSRCKPDRPVQQSGAIIDITDGELVTHSAPRVGSSWRRWAAGRCWRCRGSSRCLIASPSPVAGSHPRTLGPRMTAHDLAERDRAV